MVKSCMNLMPSLLGTVLNMAGSLPVITMLKSTLSAVEAVSRVSFGTKPQQQKMKFCNKEQAVYTNDPQC